jgi:ferredoxin
MLVINPDECIDCGVCEPECPIDAIEAESEDNLKWLEVNREFSEKWPNITERIDSMPEADKYEDTPNKYDQFFSENPGQGT